MITDCMSVSDTEQNSLQICNNLHMGYFELRAVPCKSYLTEIKESQSQ